MKSSTVQHYKLKFSFKPFLPTGPKMTPKLIFVISELTIFKFSKCYFDGFLQIKS